ncbi:hypothetical protein GOV04_00010 [Candidatus Woesearchaeota archaeon]|nr:hypothetical protein [Candidatus Woesearchaeota archaeon]
MKSKKSQLYIFSVLVLTIVAAAVIISSSRIAKPQSTSSSLANNYALESVQTVNNALYNNQNPWSALKNFNNEFTVFASTKSSDFKSVQILTYNNSIYLNNKLSKTISVVVGNQSATLISDQEQTFNNAKNVLVNYENSAYSFKINRQVQVHSLMIINSQNQKSVYLS